LDNIIRVTVDDALIPFIEVGGAFIVFAAIWAGVGFLFLRDGGPEQAWRAIKALPAVAQAAMWLLFLPVMAGLWVWETTWPFIVRAALLAGLAGWNLMIFLPKWLTGVRP
jgi:hypothetical protein